MKVRQEERIISVAVIIAIGVNSDGRREIFGTDIGPSEAETFWTGFLRKLAHRGLWGLKLAVSEAREGIEATVATVLNATWQVPQSTSCARSWRMPAGAAGASSRPSSPTPSPKDDTEAART